MIRLSSSTRATTALPTILATTWLPTRQTTRTTRPIASERQPTRNSSRSSRSEACRAQAGNNWRRLRRSPLPPVSPLPPRGISTTMRERRAVRQFARPADHEFLGMRIEIALAERRGVERIEQLHDRAHADRDFVAAHPASASHRHDHVADRPALHRLVRGGDVGEREGRHATRLISLPCSSARPMAATACSRSRVSSS